MPKAFLLFLFLGLSSFSFFANSATEVDCYKYAGCIGGSGSRGSSSANPSFGNQIRINPSAVPTEKGIGIEGILYKSEIDVAIVQGLGRVGAGISPSNSEETFFGPPGLEYPADYLERKQREEKLPKQKVTLATALNIIKRNNAGLKSRSLQLGVMGRYNNKTKNVSPGGGLNGALGPFTFGASLYDDETELVDEMLPPEEQPLIKYRVQTLTGGISLGSVLLDYSLLEMKDKDSEAKSTVRLITGSLLVKRIILTVSKRMEDSDRQMYNFSTKLLETNREKEEYFGGLQANVTKNLMFGLLYNYYLLREYSITATLFF